MDLQGARKPKVPFMDDFKSEMVFNPGEEPDNFDDKNFPSWEKVKKVTMLVDPANEKPIAHWSTRGKCPFFFNSGYLRKNPLVVGEFKWCHHPDERPYVVEGNLEIYNKLLPRLEFVKK